MHTAALALAIGALFAHGGAALKLAVGGAMDPTHNHHPLQRVLSDSSDGTASSPSPVTINVRNLWGAPMTAVVVNAAGSPGWGGAGTIANGATASYYLPPHGNGQITLGHNTNPLGSKIELNNGFNTPVTQLYMDISYVDGFSVPIVCECGGISTGCSKPLFHQNIPCSHPEPGPICINDAPDNGPPEPFFAACRNEAYVISNQSGAGTGNFCASNVVQCCIGVACASQKRSTSLPELMAARRGLAPA